MNIVIWDGYGYDFYLVMLFTKRCPTAAVQQSLAYLEPGQAMIFQPLPAVPVKKLKVFASPCHRTQ